MKQLIRDRGEQWLEANGREASHLIALWDLTHGRALLLEASGKFFNVPRGGLAMIQLGITNPKAALPWIESLIAAEPANAEGHLLKAWALGGTGHAGALAALRPGRAAGPTGVSGSGQRRQWLGRGGEWLGRQQISAGGFYGGLASSYH